MKKIGTIAEAYRIEMPPHNPNRAPWLQDLFYGGVADH